MEELGERGSGAAHLQTPQAREMESSGHVKAAAAVAMAAQAASASALTSHSSSDGPSDAAGAPDPQEGSIIAKVPLRDSEACSDSTIPAAGAIQLV